MVIEKIDAASFGRDDLNSLAAKLNEVIEFINSSNTVPPALEE